MPSQRCADPGVRPLAPLQDPLWVTSLLVLLLNDVLLKSVAGDVPLLQPLTGKLSDVAGLVMAPTLAWVVVLGAFGSRRLSWLAFACVPLVFAAINLDPACARWWEAAWASIGVTQRVWTDPTDLLTLPSLLLAYRLCRSPNPVTTTTQARLGALVGAFACVASSNPWNDTIRLPSVRNATPGTLEVTVQPYLGELHCDDVEAPIDHVDVTRFLPAERVKLSSGEQASLVGVDDDLTPIYWSQCNSYLNPVDAGSATPDAGNPQGSALDAGSAPDGEPPLDAGLADAGLDAEAGADVSTIAPLASRCRCGAALVSSPHLDPTLITWDLRGVEDRWHRPSVEELPLGSVYLERFGQRLRAQAGERMHTTPWPHEVGDE